jgi:hypothetical protein
LAYVSVPKDLSKVKTKVMFNLTKRQLVCFGTAAAIGVPIFFATKGVIGNSAAVLVMIAFMLPAFFAAMYEKDGQPAERLFLNIVRAKWYYPPVRPYKTENFYHVIEMEGKLFEQNEETATAGTPLARKCRTGGEKQKRP